MIESKFDLLGFYKIGLCANWVQMFPQSRLSLIRGGNPGGWQYFLNNHQWGRGNSPIYQGGRPE